MDIKDLTAAELADALDGLRHEPHNTGWASMLDEATLAYRDLSPELSTHHAAYAQARMVHMGSIRVLRDRYSDDDWSTLTAAAADLARALRPLGSFRVERCQRRTGWGTCGLPLGTDGECRYAEHID